MAFDSGKLPFTPNHNPPRKGERSDVCFGDQKSSSNGGLFHLKQLDTFHRDRGLDAVSGVMILFMVTFHIAGQYERTGLFTSFAFRPLMFFMFWFFYKGGCVEKGRDLKEVVLTGVKRLLVPALIWLVIGAAVYESVNLLLSRPLGLTSDLLYEFLREGSVVYHLPVWFLFSLFLVRVVYSLLRSAGRGMKLLICALCLIAATSLNKAAADLPLYIANTLTGLGFYLLGNVMKGTDRSWRIILLALIVYILVLSSIPSSIDFRTNRLIEGSYPIALLFSFSGCLLLRGFFTIIDSRILQYIGRYSMVWLLVHWPVKYVGGILVGQMPEMSFIAITLFLLLLTATAVEGCLWISVKLNLSFLFGDSVPPIIGVAGTDRSLRGRPSVVR